MERFLIIAIGGLCLLAALFNWEWWFESRRVKFITQLLSRTGARVVYAIIGIAFISIVFFI